MANPSIPASAFVSVNPSVINTGGAAINLNGLFLTTNTQIPLGTVLQFPTAAAVSTYFGPSSNEYTEALIYFAGYVGQTASPGALLFAQYNNVAVSGYLRGGNLGAMTLTQLQAITPGTLSIKIAGVTNTSSSINLSAATSFSNAASIIQAAFTTPNFGVTYNATANAFQFTSTATGATQTVAFNDSGAFATALNLTAATGAVLSQGAAAAVPAAFMAGIVAQTTNWATFMTLFDPDNGSGNTVKQAFAAWNTTQNNRYAYIAWDTDITPTQSTNASTSLGQILLGNGNSGTCLIYEATNLHHAAFVCGVAAAINFNQPNGNTNFGYRSQSGLTPAVNNQTVMTNLIANGYNSYDAVANSTNQWQYFYPGSVTGPFLSMQRYVNQIWLNANFQTSLVNLLTNTPAVPYVQAGYALIKGALQTNINAALSFGMIQPGTVLSAAQIAQVNNQAGTRISDILAARGWFLQVLDPGAVVRGQGGSPIINFWYTDGGSVLQINLASIDVE